MSTYNITAARNDLYNIVDEALANELVRITTKNGNVVMMSEEDWESVLETLYLMGDPEFMTDVEEARNTPLSQREVWH